MLKNFNKIIISFLIIALISANFLLFKNHTAKAASQNPININIGQRLQQIGIQFAQQAIQGLLQQVLKNVNLGPLNSLLGQLTQQIQNTLLNPLKLDINQIEQLSNLDVLPLDNLGDALQNVQPLKADLFSPSQLAQVSNWGESLPLDIDDLDLTQANTVVNDWNLLNQQIQTGLLNPNIGDIVSENLSTLENTAPINLNDLSASQLNTAINDLNLTDEQILSGTLNPNLGENLDGVIEAMNDLPSNLDLTQTNLTSGQIQELADLELINPQEQMNLSAQLEKLPPIQELPMNLSPASAAAEAAATAAGTAGGTIYYVQEVGRQLGEIIKLAKEAYAIKVADEATQKNTTELDKLETDEDKDREAGQSAAAAARDGIGQALDKLDKEILEKVVEPNIIKNWSDMAAKTSKEYKDQHLKEFKEGADEILKNVNDDRVKRIYEETFSEPEATDFENKIAVDECPKAEEIDNAKGKDWHKLWVKSLNPNCTFLPVLYALEAVNEAKNVKTDKVTDYHLLSQGDIAPEIEIKDGKPEIVRTREEIEAQADEITTRNYEELKDARNDLPDKIDAEEMPENVTQKLAEETSNWLEQIIEQGLSALQGLLSGLMDQQGEEAGAPAEAGGAGWTGETVSQSGELYNPAQRARELEAAKSLLKSQKLLNENLSNQYLYQQQISLGNLNQIQSLQQQILGFLKDLYLRNQPPAEFNLYANIVKGATSLQIAGNQANVFAVNEKIEILTADGLTKEIVTITGSPTFDGVKTTIHFTPAVARTTGYTKNDKVKELVVFTIAPPSSTAVSCDLPAWAQAGAEGNNTKITASGVGEIIFNKTGNIVKSSYYIVSQIDTQNKNIDLTKQRIAALQLAMSANENFIALLKKSLQPSLPPLDEVLAARQTAISLSARAVSSESDNLFQLDADTQKMNLDVVYFTTQLASRRDSISQMQQELGLRLNTLNNQYGTCLKK